MKRFLITLGAAAVVASCGPKGTGDIPVVDVTKTYPHKDITLQEVADVEYIPLETREGFLIDYRVADNVEDDIVLTSNNNGDIMIFDRHTGRGIASFNRKGRGPGEYSGVGFTAIDGERGEIFVTPNMYSTHANKPMYVYDMQGKHLRTLELSVDAGFIHDYDAEHLFFYNSDISRPEPFGLISKADGAVSYLPVKFAGRDNMTVEAKMGEAIFRTSKGDAVVKSREGYVSSEPGIDTVYNWDRATGRLVPLVARTPSFGSMEYPIGLFCWQQSRDYMFLQTFERKYDVETREGFDQASLMIDKRTGEIFEGKIVNGDFADERPLQYHTQDGGIPFGMVVEALQPLELLDLHKEGKLRGRLAEIAPTLKEDDNPVMMIVKLK